MKHLKIAGLCLASMLVMSMALAGNASATLPSLLWLLCLEKGGTAGAPPTKYINSSCTETNAGLTGKWESAGLPTGGSDTVRLLAYSLLLIDTIGGVRIDVHCPDAGTSWGLIENGKLIIKVAEITNGSEAGCKLTGSILGCKTSANIGKIKGVNLPWTAEIVETEDKYLSRVKTASASTKPGWSIECGGVTDECTESTEKPELAKVGNGVTVGVLLVLLE
jgi:hypothetical protein